MARLKDLKRMCEMYTLCDDCPLSSDEVCMPDSLPDNADEIVDKWVLEHPVKTYAMDFFEKFPNATKAVIEHPKFVGRLSMETGSIVLLMFVIVRIVGINLFPKIHDLN